MGKMNSLFIASGFSEFPDEGLEKWLIRLDQAKKSKVLEYEMFSGVQRFFSFFQSREIQIIKESEIFWQLKPRLQRMVRVTAIESSFSSSISSSPTTTTSSRYPSWGLRMSSVARSSPT